MREYMRKYRRAHPHLSTPYVQAHRKKKQFTQPFHRADLTPEYADLKSHSQILYSVTAIFLFLLFIFGHSGTITFEGVQVFIGRCSVTIVELTGLVVILMFSWRHVRDLWREMK